LPWIAQTPGVRQPFVHTCSRLLHLHPEQLSRIPNDQRGEVSAQLLPYTQPDGLLPKRVPAAGTGGKDQWKYSVLHTFGKGHDGCEPEGNLAIDQKGNLYGGTVLGGAHGYGMVFELTL